MWNQEILDITEEEIIYAPNLLKNNSAHGDDDIKIEMVKQGKKPVSEEVKQIFNVCLK